MTDLRPEICAARLLSQQQRLDTGAWVRSLRFERPIVFDTFAHYAKLCGTQRPLSAADGCTVRYGDTALVLYQPGWTVARVNYTLAHEVGHILLDHTDAPGQEKEANRFASALLIPFAPMRVLRERGITDPRSIARFFGVSLSAARVACERASVRTDYDGKILALYRERLHCGERKTLDILFEL